MSFEKRSLARTKLLSLRDEHPTPFPDNGMSVNQYLTVVRRGILAEFHAFVRKSFPPRAYHGWQEDRLITHRVVASYKGNDDEGNEHYKFELDDTSMGINDLNGSLCIFRNYLCLVNVNGNDDGFLQRGIDLEDINFDDNEVCYSTDDRVFVIGYAGSYVNELAAVLEMMESPVPILKSIADPRKRRVVAMPMGSLDLSENLNAEQHAAICGLRYDVEGIQGPPGTGKSTTIDSIIRRRMQPLTCALVTCVQNKAVDSVAEKLAKGKTPFFVLGKAENLGGVAKHWTIPQQVLRNPRVKALQKRVDAVERLHQKMLTKYKQARSAFGMDRVYKPRAYGRPGICEDCFSLALHTRCGSCLGSTIGSTELFNKTRECKACWKLRCLPCVRAGVKKAIRRQAFEASYSGLRFFTNTVLVNHRGAVGELLQEAKLEEQGRILEMSCAVLCTVDVTGQLLDGSYERCTTRLTTALLDEAGTVPEPKMTLIAKLGVGQIICIGDQKQLRPFTNIDECKTGLRPISFFHRLDKCLPGQVPMLRTQYRMDPKICKLVSDVFYDKQLTTDQGTAMARAMANMGRGLVVSWHNHKSKESKADKGFSTCNMHEASWVVAVLMYLDRKGFDKEVLVITFYKEQMRQILAEYQCQYKVEFGSAPDVNSNNNKRRILTVDACQGSEADIVICSTVRSNSAKRIGFLADKPRINVAVSRAREMLLFVGNKKTVGSDPTWGRIIASAAEFKGLEEHFCLGQASA